MTTDIITKEKAIKINKDIQFFTDTDARMNILQIQKIVQDVTDIQKTLMVYGTHYGLVPGCGAKPTLFKAGAEMLALAFNLLADYRIEIEKLENDGILFSVVTTLFSRATGEKIATGIGSCSTKETKFARKNPADIHNTCLKMAKKRSFVDSVISSLNITSLFTQDLEEMENIEIPNEKPCLQKDDFITTLNKEFTDGMEYEEKKIKYKKVLNSLFAYKNYEEAKIWLNDYVVKIKKNENYENNN